MILIAHRGNIYGPDPINENKPEHLEYAMSLGFYVEADVWYIDNTFYLGHDKPQYKICIDFLVSSVCESYGRNIICHAKTPETFYQLLTCGKNIHCFFHDKDDCTLTSNGWIWTYPGKPLTEKSICVMPELSSLDKTIYKCIGVCTDYVSLLHAIQIHY